MKFRQKGKANFKAYCAMLHMEIFLKIFKKMFLFIFLMFLSISSVAFAQQEEYGPQFGLPPGMEDVSVMVFKVNKIPVFKEATPILGTFVPSEKIELKFPERGIVKEVYFEEGDDINEGDILAELEEREFLLKRDYSKNKYESENSLLMSMKKEYHIKNSLYEQGAILKEKLQELELKIESQKYKMESTKKEWELAEDSLSKTKLFSNTKGKVEKRDIEKGELVSPEAKAFTILRIDKVFAEAGITEKDISKIELGQQAEIRIDAYPDTRFKGTVKNILASIQGASRTLTLRIEIDNALYNYKILPGMFFRGEIILAEMKNVYLVPTDILLELDKGTQAIYTITPHEYFEEDNIEETEIKGTINLNTVQVKYKGSEYSCIRGIPEGAYAVIRSEGELLPGITGRIINIEEFEGN